MKNTMKVALTGLVLFCSVNSFGSSYGESKLATCETFELISSTVGSQQADGSLVSETQYRVRFVNGAEIRAEKVQYEDVDQWYVSTAADTLLVVSKSFQPGGMKYNWSIVTQGRSVRSGACNQKSNIVLY